MGRVIDENKYTEFSKIVDQLFAEERKPYLLNIFELYDEGNVPQEHRYSEDSLRSHVRGIAGWAYREFGRTDPESLREGWFMLKMRMRREFQARKGTERV